MSDCIFCKIANKEIPAQICYEDDDLVAFEDINPQAPVHTLIITRRCIPSVADLTATDTNLVGNMIQLARQLASDKGIAVNGYRLVFNCREHGGQEVDHIHLHLLGGRMMTWPPG